MKKTVLLLLVIIAFFATSFTRGGLAWAHIDKIIYLQGKVGERNLVLKIKCYNESPIRYLNYYFEEEKMEGYLEGNLIGNAWQFSSVEKDKEERNLVIKEQENGSWIGFWREGSNPKINLVLKTIVVDPESKFKKYWQEKELDLYDAYKISILKLEKTKTEKISPNFNLDWYQEKESQISLFRLRSENKKLVLDSINTALESLQLSLIQNYFRLNPINEIKDIQAELSYFNEELISFHIVSKVSIKKQEPVIGYQPFNLDLKSGQSIPLESIVWFDPKNPIPPANEVYEVYQYRKNTFAPMVFSLIKKSYPEKLQTSPCELNKEESWVAPDFILTPQGIQFSYPASANCSDMDWAVLPYQTITNFLQKKYSFQNGH